MGVANTISSGAREQAIAYVERVFKQVKAKNKNEREYYQAVKEFFDSVIPALALHPQYEKHSILERMAEPDRLITFKVPWVDDQNKVHVNRGYRVQFNNSIGPYKGGIRFHPSVNASIVKFLGFEQVFKNALTGQPIGGGKGGADFDPKGKSEGEIMRFTQSFMTELSKYIGRNIDVPAGDIGVGAKEIGYMFGQYNKIKGGFEAGVLTGKGIHYGGSLGRVEATGYGAVYFVEEMLKSKDLSFKDRTVIVSGSGNVSIYAIEKATQLGATVVACSDSDGFIYDENGIDVNTVKRLKEVEKKRLSEYVLAHPHAKYTEGCTNIWSIPCDIAMPCATQYEINETSARQLIQNGVKAIGEGANKPSSHKAIRLFLENDILFGPAKAVNAGGVAVSSLEMSQNELGMSWSFEKVNTKLQKIMKHIFDESMETARAYGAPGNLIVGANIASFINIADVMIDHGV